MLGCVIPTRASSFFFTLFSPDFVIVAGTNSGALVRGYGTD